MLPNACTSCGAVGSSPGVGRRPRSVKNATRGVEQVRVIDNELPAFVDSGGAAAARDAADGERLLLGLVAEHVEDAGRGGDGASAEDPFDPRAELLLREELLEGAPARDDAVALEVDGGVGRLPVETGGHDKNLPGEGPSGREDDQAVVGVFDHVHDVAEVHDIGRRSFLVRKEGRVPAGHGNAHLLQPQEVVSAAAAVVEERALGMDEVVVERKGDGPRQRSAADRGSVCPCRTH